MPRLLGETTMVLVPSRGLGLKGNEVLIGFVRKPSSSPSTSQDTPIRQSAPCRKLHRGESAATDRRNK